MNKRFFVLFLCMIGIDQGTKFLASLLGIVSINCGFSFSLYCSEYSINIHATILLLMFFIVRGAIYTPAIAIFFGGAVSNFLDRLMFRGIRDFIPLPFLSLTINLADIAITASVLFLVVQSLYHERTSDYL